MSKKFLTGIDLNQNQLIAARVENVGTLSTSGKVAGQVAYYTSDNTLYFFNGTAWIAATGTLSPATTVTSGTSFGTSSAVGTSANYAREDHQHGTPTAPTASSVGAVANVSSSTPSINTDSFANRPAFGTAGRLFVDTTNNLIYRDTGSAWQQIAAFATVGSSAVGDSVAAGTAVTYARSDHTHGREAFGSVTAQTSFGGSSANGSATTIARSDHTHGTPTAPTASSVGAVANGGSTPSIKAVLASAVTNGNAAAEGAGAIYITTDTFLLYRSNATSFDQLTPFSGSITAVTAGGSTVVGTANTFARGDHAHALTAGTPGSSAVGDSAAAGSSANVARADHTHGREAFGAVSAQTTFAASSANGSATTVSHSDHTHGTPTHDAAAHSAIKISDLAAPTAAVSFGSQRITTLADPTSAQDAATKAYVDAFAQGLDFKQSVKAVSTSALTVTYANGTAGVGATLTATTNVVLPTIDGQSLSVADRVLIAGQSSQFQNGIYTVTSLGVGGSSPWVLTRATDGDTAGEQTAGSIAYIETGTSYAQTQFVQTATVTTVGTTAAPWSQFTGQNSLSAGAGLTSTAGVLAVGAGTGITVAADSVAIDTAVVVRKYAVAITGGSTSEVITHSLGTQDVTVSVYTASGSFDEVEVDIEHTSTSTITLRWAVAPSSGAYRVVVHG